MWRPAVLVIPRKVEFCTKPKFHSYITNYGGLLRKSETIKKGNNYQLHATVLVDVCYRIYADIISDPNKFDMLEYAKRWDRNTTSPGNAYQDIFNRRLSNGQSYATLALDGENLHHLILGLFVRNHGFVENYLIF